jgi:hypothetical protein
MASHAVGPPPVGPQWFIALTLSFNQQLLLDRHFLARLERDMCIASLVSDGQRQQQRQQRSLWGLDSLRLLLARNLGTKMPRLRELPVSLLRLYFSGQEHFEAVLDGIPHPAFYHLLALARGDALRTATTATTKSVNLCSKKYVKNRRLVGEYLKRLVDVAFCSFERALRLLFHSLARSDWCDAGLVDALYNDTYWRGLPLPPSFVRDVPRNASRAQLLMWLTTGSNLIWYLCVWRCNVTLLLEKYVKPWPAAAHVAESHEAGRWVVYKMQLYRDTHLDLLTVMKARECYDDAQLVHSSIMATHYPTCNRVCCAEELTDLSAYSLDNFKTGAQLKERSTLAHKTGHLYGIKTGNNICKDRNSPEIIRACGEQDPVIYDQVKETCRCGMLGNFPGATRGTLTMAARMRVTWSFWPENADRIMTRDEIDRFMHPYCNPYIQSETRRAEKLRKEQAKLRRANPALSGPVAKKKLATVMEAWDAKERVKMTYDKTVFKMWLIKCRHFVSSLMREHFFFVQESNGVIDHYLSYDYKWQQYKNITRIANGQCRNELSRQAATLPWTQRFDWSVLEFIEKSPDGKYDVKRGITMVFHTAALKVTKKVMKRNFLGILEVKATGIEEKIHFDNKTAPLKPIYVSDAEARAQGDARTMMSEEELHFMCYCIAMKRNPVIATSLFQVMGMSRAGVESIRKWLLDYYTYDVPDDSFKKGLLKFARDNFNDYLIMKTALYVISFLSKNMHIFHLPKQFALRQIDAQRKGQLSINDWEPTPARSGYHYRCPGCQKFANSIVLPQHYPVHSNHCELAFSRHRVFTGSALMTNNNNNTAAATMMRSEACNLTLLYDHKWPRIVEYHRKKYALSENSRALALARINGAITTTETMGVEENELDDTSSQRVTKKSENVSFLNVAFYNPHDKRAYCIKNKRRRMGGGVWSLAECERAPIVMTGDRGRIFIRCTRVTISNSLNDTLGGASDASEQEGGRGKRWKCATEEMEEEEDDDEEEDEEDEEGEDDDEGGGGGGGGGSEEDEAVGAQQPGYETEMLNLMTDVSEMTPMHLARLESYAKTHVRELTQNLPKAGNRAPSQQQSPLKNNKKRILRAVQQPIQARYNCRLPLQAIDMIGVVKNGHCLCVECGVMTVYDNHNMTHYGPVCGRHISSTMQRHHPAWQSDSLVAQYLDGWRACGGAQTEMTKAKKRGLHPLAKVAVIDRVGPLDRLCHCCQLLPPEVRVTVAVASYRMVSVMCCGICHHNLRPLMQRKYVPALAELIQFAVEHHYTHTLHNHSTGYCT